MGSHVLAPSKLGAARAMLNLEGVPKLGHLSVGNRDRLAAHREWCGSGVGRRQLSCRQIGLVSPDLPVPGFAQSPDLPRICIFEGEGGFGFPSDPGQFFDEDGAGFGGAETTKGHGSTVAKI
jgi:hypothetical protein